MGGRSGVVGATENFRHWSTGWQEGWPGREGGTAGAVEQHPVKSAQLVVVVGGDWRGREAGTAGAVPIIL